MKTVLAIAGTDPSGGAGIQADLKTFSALGAYGCSAITALVAQNTRGVQSVYRIEPDFVAAQLDSVFSDVRIDTTKIGMLAETDIVEAVAERLARYRVANVVLDTVMLAKSGDPLLSASAVETLRQRLLPQVSLITPNLPEAAALRLLLVEGPDDPHSLQGLQEEPVDLVQLPAELDRIAGGQDHDGRQGGDQDRDGDGQHGADLSPGGGGEHQPGCRHHGGQDADAQQHGEKILHIGDVRGAPGDQAGRPEAVHLSGGEGLHLVEHTLTELGGELGGDPGGESDGTQVDETGEHSDGCHDDGEDSDRGAGLCRHPAVDHPGQKSGQHHLPDGGQQHQDRQPGHLPSAQRYLGEDRFHRVFVCLLDVE